MNAYADVATIKSEQYLDLEADRLTTLEPELRKILEAVSREIDKLTDRHFYVWEGARYFDGTGRFFKLDEDLLSITTFKLDEDGDATFELTLATTDYILYPRNRFPKEYIKPATDGDYGSFAPNVLNGIEIDGIWGHGDGISATPYRDSGTDINMGGNLSATATALTVDDGTKFGAGQTIRMDSEQCYIESISTHVLTIRRAVNGTTGAIHLDDLDIYIYEYPADIVQVCLIESIRAAKAGHWLDVSGSAEVATFSVKKGFHAKSMETLKRYIKQGW